TRASPGRCPPDARVSGGSRGGPVTGGVTTTAAGALGSRHGSASASDHHGDAFPIVYATPPGGWVGAPTGRPPTGAGPAPPPGAGPARPVMRWRASPIPPAPSWRPGPPAAGAARSPGPG